jgi:hypothetical protein
LKIDVGIMTRLFSLIPAGDDRLMDRIIAQYQPDGKVADKLIFPKNYQTLHDAIDAPENKRPSLLKKRIKLYEKHDYNEYTPPWDFPLTAVVKAFGMDDEWLRDNPRYPWELVHWQGE